MPTGHGYDTPLTQWTNGAERQKGSRVKALESRDKTRRSLGKGGALNSQTSTQEYFRGLGVHGFTQPSMSIERGLEIGRESSSQQNSTVLGSIKTDSTSYKPLSDVQSPSHRVAVPAETSLRRKYAIIPQSVPTTRPMLGHECEKGIQTENFIAASEDRSSPIFIHHRIAILEDSLEKLWQKYWYVRREKIYWFQKATGQSYPGDGEDQPLEETPLQQSQPDQPSSPVTDYLNDGGDYRIGSDVNSSTHASPMHPSDNPDFTFTASPLRTSDFGSDFDFIAGESQLQHPKER